MGRRIRLTDREIEALLAAAGNVDPCMFDEVDSTKEGDREYEAFLSGQEKLRRMLAARTGKKDQKPGK